MKKESVELSLTFCGYEVCDAGYHYIPRKRNYYMLHIVRSGKGICKINGGNYFIEGNDAFLVFPEMEYSFVADPEEGCTLLWIGFMGMRAGECVMRSGFSQENLIRTTKLVTEVEELVEKMLQVKEMTFANDLRRNGILKLFFAQFIDEYNNEFSKGNVQKEEGLETSEYIRSAISYIAQNYSQNIKINELADYVGVNRSYLASSFKKATGYSPKEYLLSLRMERAKSLLETSDMTINGISNAIGYSDQLAFSRMFKKYTGISPTVYRDEHKK
jgi:AraC-like DNA-binding protein